MSPHSLTQLKDSDRLRQAIEEHRNDGRGREEGQNDQ